jgi:hypothetical protein
MSIPLPRRTTFWLLIAGFAVLATIGGASVWLVGANKQYGREISHTREVQLRTALLLLLLRQAETGQRSYLLTREDEYLKADLREPAGERRQVSRSGPPRTDRGARPRAGPPGDLRD